MSYLDDPAQRAALAALPLDSALRGVPLERVVARLQSERALAQQSAAPVLQAVILAERAPDEALAQSIRSVELQSHPQARAIVLPAGATLDRSTLGQSRFVTFLRHGDRLHPSAAAWLAIGQMHEESGVVTWGELQPDGRGGVAWAQRNPALQRVSLLHFPYLRNAFAVSGALAAAYPGNLAREAVHNQLHLFQLWLAGRADARWSSHPEYFLIRADARAAERPEDVARQAYAGHGEAYAAAFAALAGEFGVVAAPQGEAAPYRLVPRAQPGSLSVVIPFRDKPEMTARAAQSVARQRFAGALEIVLVNNRSDGAALAALQAALRGLPGAARWRLVDYDAPFNHSAECMLGMRESRGEVVLFMNNDAELLGEGALAELAAWAAHPGVASVGAAIENPQAPQGHNAAAAGMEARLAPVPYFDSLVEERSEPAFTPFVREVFGNSFAFAAVSRASFGALGGLDALRFPNGFNDVEYACRARRKGYRHIALGHVRVRHAPGQSRGRTDEAVQKTLLRTLYPELGAAALGELGFDPVIARMKMR